MKSWLPKTIMDHLLFEQSTATVDGSDVLASLIGVVVADEVVTKAVVIAAATVVGLNVEKIVGVVVHIAAPVVVGDVLFVVMLIGLSVFVAVQERAFA